MTKRKALPSPGPTSSSSKKIKSFVEIEKEIIDGLTKQKAAAIKELHPLPSVVRTVPAAAAAAAAAVPVFNVKRALLPVMRDLPTAAAGAAAPSDVVRCSECEGKNRKGTKIATGETRLVCNECRTTCAECQRESKAGTTIIGTRRLCAKCVRKTSGLEEEKSSSGDDSSSDSDSGDEMEKEGELCGECGEESSDGVLHASGTIKMCIDCYMRCDGCDELQTKCSDLTKNEDGRRECAECTAKAKADWATIKEWAAKKKANHPDYECDSCSFNHGNVGPLVKGSDGQRLCTDCRRSCCDKCAFDSEDTLPLKTGADGQRLCTSCRRGEAAASK